MAMPLTHLFDFTVRFVLFVPLDGRALNPRFVARIEPYLICFIELLPFSSWHHLLLSCQLLGTVTVMAESWGTPCEFQCSTALSGLHGSASSVAVFANRSSVVRFCGAHRTIDNRLISLRVDATGCTALLAVPAICTIHICAVHFISVIESSQLVRLDCPTNECHFCVFCAPPFMPRPVAMSVLEAIKLINFTVHNHRSVVNCRPIECGFKI